MYILLIIISLSYLTLIISLIIGFDKTPSLKSKNKTAQHRFSIIIPFRNEVDNIKDLANSLMQLDYPNTHFEILFVNDNSTDNSVPLLTEFIIQNSNWKLLDNIRKSKSPKKDAIDTAIIHSKYDWIITTDADCEIPKKWLANFNNFIEDNSIIKMIAAPVSYKTNNSFLHQFQLMDFLSLIGTTIGSFGIKKPFMCNGANLCYHKQSFINLKGFNGNNNIASGDDVFLLEKFSKNFPKQVHYLKSIESLVFTKPENSVKGLINQRIRWASKTSATKNIFGKFIGIIVFSMNLISLWAIFFGLWIVKYSLVALLILLLKLLIDYILIKKTYQFTNQKLSLKIYVSSSLLYPFFVVYVVVKSFFTKVKWKDRVFEK